MSGPTEKKLLGLFPALAELGGVEASGRIAWAGLANSNRFSPRNLELFEYIANGAGESQNKPTKLSSPTRAKFAAIVRALKMPKPPACILVWHIGLLKLVPFFRSPKAKRILYLHGIESWKRQDLLTQRMLRRVTIFLTNSDYTWSRFLSYHPEFGSGRHLTVPLGIGHSVVDRLPLPDVRPTVVMVGRIAGQEDYKGHRQVIEAWPLVLRQIPNARLWIVGDGDLRSEFEALVQRNSLAKSVTFWGAVSEKEKEVLLLESRCLALPSRAEGFGLVYLEAMRLGRPCLVSTVDAGREVVNPPEAGLDADPGKPDELAAALCRLLSDGAEWERWSAQARGRYESKYTAKHFQDRLLAAMFPCELAMEAARVNPRVESEDSQPGELSFQSLRSSSTVRN
jgi:phosphatidylinositol alpha-1,6-mannosyltransferase